ncbi:RNA polymerase sigma factor SigF [Abditibacteriota bacterium]|nr:RNA polymerase sigma factor SigF [Abditibacteriota bacterium]
MLAPSDDLFASELELAQLAERGGHDEETVLKLFRRLRGSKEEVRGGDPSSLRDHLVMVHAPLVEHCARGFLASGEPIDDLIQEGYVGLIKAVDRFDPNKGIKFSTYACHLISGEIRHYLRDLGRLIHEPGWHFELRGRINRASDWLTQSNGRVPTAEEIANHISVKPETVREVQERSSTLYVDSLEAKTEESQSEGRVDFLERFQGEPSSASDEGRIEDQMFLEMALPQLRALEQTALTLFFFDELSKSDIARKLGISVNYVSYLVKRGTESLKRILEASEPIPGALAAQTSASQQQARAAYLLGLARASAQNDERRTFAPKSAVPVLTKPGVASLSQFSGWLDDEVARVGRYGGEFALCWLSIKNWTSATQDLSAAEKRQAAGAAATLARRLVRGVDKVAALQSADPAGFHFLALLPATGLGGKALEKRWVNEFSKPDLPGITAPLHLRSAFAICPRDGRLSEELFEFLGKQLA